MNEKQLQEAFIQFLAKKSGAKNQQELEKYIQNLGEAGLKQAQEEFMQLMQQQTQAAKHGAKLSYIKKLSRKCSDDEELVYYKKGGQVDCGCVPKAQKGTEVANKTEQTYDVKTGKMRPATKEEIEKRKQNRTNASKGKGEGKYIQGKPEKKNCGGFVKNPKKIIISASGSKVCPKCGKVHTGPCKFKVGGSLNGVLFYQGALRKVE